MGIRKLFKRYIIEIFWSFLDVIDFILFIFEKIIFKKDVVKKEKKDIVFLLFYPIGCYRLRELIAKLESIGISVECLSKDFEDFKNYILNFGFIHFKTVVLFLIIYFVIKKYNPKIIILQVDTLPRHFKNYINKKKVKLINISHSVTFSTQLFSSINYDYYFMFGRKSLENLLNNSYLESGETNVILTGSPFFQREEVLSWEYRNFIVLAGSYFQRGYYLYQDFEYFVEFYKSLDYLIAKFKDYIFLFKPHIRREIELEYRYILKHNNVILIDNAENIYKVLKFSKLLICDVSVASIEAAAAGCPFIIYDWLYSKNKNYAFSDQLGDINFFERATNKENLENLFKQRISKEFFLDSQDKLYSYYKSHIEIEKSIDHIAHCLKNIILNKIDSLNCIYLKK